ncbi:MAG TPA: glycosyl hydrolase 108 family protein [Alphaproteobacteria bacterium]|nr:glycosyl hydrolase 108 family protein [Alphaproteobacteria bacterium]
MMRAKRGLSAIYAAWAVMATSALSAHAAETKRTPQAAVPQAAPAALPSEPRAAVDFMIRRFEGTGLGDNGHGLSRYGIVGWVNGLSSRGVARLSYGGGAAILERNYWDAVDAGRLPASMRFIAFDAAMQFGPPRARRLIAGAQGDPHRLLREMSGLYEQLVERHPHLRRWQGKWRHRQAVLAALLDQGVQPTEAPIQPPTSTQIPTPTVTAADLNRREQGRLERTATAKRPARPAASAAYSPVAAVEIK